MKDKKKLDKKKIDGKSKQVKDWEPKPGARERPEASWRYIMSLPYNRDL